MKAGITKTYEKVQAWIVRLYRYCSVGVWSDMRPLFHVRLIKTLNLSVNAFFNGDIQTKACAMTYRTVLALVPALALIFAIGRGFGLQEVIRDELEMSFPSQKVLLDHAFSFVESYLNQSSEGIFVGVGIALLLWTLISILGSVEDSFNSIWGITQGRSFWRKVTDYLAIFLVLPVLMICGGGLSAMFTTSIGYIFEDGPVAPLINIMLDIASFVIVWLFFTGVYMMIPNTKVKFRNAFVAGVFAGTAFIILQWLFISGQIYVSKYNAIYGSFAFLPLFLIWMQLVWVVTLAGAVICYASQNIYRYNFSSQIGNISPEYKLKFTLSVMTIVVQEYLDNQVTPTEEQITEKYELPNRLVSTTVQQLLDVGLLLRVLPDTKVQVFGFAPAVDASQLTVGEVVKRLRSYGSDNFIPDFDIRFKQLIESMNKAESDMYETVDMVKIKDLKINDITQNQNLNNQQS